MPEPIVEAFVRVRADTSEFRNDVAKATKQATDTASVQLQAAQSRQAAAIGAYNDSIILGTGNAKIAQAELAASSRALLIAQREVELEAYQLTRATDIYAASTHAATIAVIDEQLALTGLGTKAGTLGTIMQKLGGREREASGGLALLAGRAGLVSLAVVGAFQAVGHLTEALKVTGEAAFTTGGQLRNGLAAAIRGDVIGALQALAAHTKYEQFEGIVKGGEAGTVAMHEYSAALREAAAGAMLLNGANSQAAATMLQAAAAADAYANSLTSVASTEAFANAMAVQTAQDVNQFKANLKNNPDVQPQLPRVPLSPSQRNALAQIAAQGAGDTATTLTLQQAEADRLDKVVAQSKLNGAKRYQLLQDQANAHAAVDRTQQTIRQNAIQEANAAKAAAKARADAAEEARKAALAEAKEIFDLKAALRASRFELAEIRAEGTKTTADDVRAKEASIRELQRLYAADRKIANDARVSEKLRLEAANRAVATEKEIARKKAEVKKINEGDQGSGGLTAAGLFGAAISNFQQYGSNIASDFSGILSAQDVRGDLGGRLIKGVLQSISGKNSELSAAQLAEMKRQTAILLHMAGITYAPTYGVGGARAINASGQFVPGNANSWRGN